MRWWAPLAGLAVVGCAAAPPPVLSVADWRVLPPLAACEARVQAENWAVKSRRYDAEGRLIFGTTTPSSDSRAAEWLTWRGKTLVAVDSYLERDIAVCRGRGCPSPPGERTIERSELRWQGAQLVAVTTSRRVYRRDKRDDEVWRLHDHDERETSYDYRGPWLKAIGSYIRFEFEGDRPVRRRRKTGLIFWGDLSESWTWKGDRVATYLWIDYTERFEYDAQGRLILDRLEAPRDRHVLTKTWEYDARGAVRRTTERDVSDQRPTAERAWEYQYDGGREIEATSAPVRVGGVAVTSAPIRVETTYSGDCAKVVEGPPAPNVFDIMHAAPCFHSPGGLFIQCF